MERWVFAGFLMTAAVQDWNKKQVEVWVYQLFGGLALMTGFCRILAGTEPGWMEMAGSFCIGLCMLGAGMVSCGGIGSGDGCFFLVSSLLLRFRENLMLLCYGTVLCGIYCLGYLVWCRWHSVGYAGKRIVPFLPFLVPPGIWLLVCG